MRPIREATVDRATAWLRWFGPSRLVGIVASVGVVGVGAWWLVRVPPPPPESTIPFDVAVTSPPAATTLDGPATTDTTVPVHPVVHVAGAVAHPGVYALAPGARAHDAVLAAGGPAPDADLSMVNLAAPLPDASQLYVPRRGEAARRASPAAPTRDARGVTPAPGSGGAAPTADSAGAPGAPLDLNTASVAALEALPGIGPRTAAAIVAHRERHGPYASVEALLDVRGIGPATLAEVRPLVRAP